MASVYAAEDVDTGDTVALKLLLPELLKEKEPVVRFRREAQAGILLDHPHLVKVFDLGQFEGGALFLAMELIPGGSLADLMDLGPVEPRRALVLCRQVLEALGYAHGCGVVHRDLKPANILLVAAGTPDQPYEVAKVGDLGLVKLVGDTADALGAAKLTRTGVVFGTPAYMAPEQALGRLVDGRADLYSLGIILFEALTAVRPFDSDDPMDTMRRQVSAPPPTLAQAAGPRPAFTRDLEALVARALAKRPEDRFRDATAMRSALDEAFLSLDAVS